MAAYKKAKPATLEASSSGGWTRSELRGRFRAVGPVFKGRSLGVWFQNYVHWMARI